MLPQHNLYLQQLDQRNEMFKLKRNVLSQTDVFRYSSNVYKLKKLPSEDSYFQKYFKKFVEGFSLASRLEIASRDIHTVLAYFCLLLFLIECFTAAVFVLVAKLLNK